MNCRVSCLPDVPPAHTIIYFGGIPTPSAELWVQALASGDAIVAYLCFAGLKAPAQQKKLIIRANGVYTLVHMGAFLRGNYREAHPNGIGFYVVSLIVGAITTAWWGFIRPVVDKQKL